MTGSGQTTEVDGIRVPFLECRMLEGFSKDNDFETNRRAFRSAPGCALRQAWRKQPEMNFTPALVRTGWREDTLVVWAELMDGDIFTRATGFNQRLWELGDSFEIFLRPENQEAYVEFQVAPNGCQLQLRYPHAAALDYARQSGSIACAVLPEKQFRATTWVIPERRLWAVCAVIPARAVCDYTSKLVGSRWRFSFSRYDYTRGEPEPVISSTSPHPAADFHRQQDWGVLEFLP